MGRISLTLILLLISNTFMTFAWYGHLKFKEHPWLSKWGLLAVILLSWGIALFEYCFQVPANRLGFKDYGGPFTLVQLKVIQEALNLTVFTGFTLFLFRQETLHTNHILAFILIILAVFLVFQTP